VEAVPVEETPKTPVDDLEEVSDIELTVPAGQEEECSRIQLYPEDSLLSLSVKDEYEQEEKDEEMAVAGGESPQKRSRAAGASSSVGGTPASDSANGESTLNQILEMMKKREVTDQERERKWEERDKKMEEKMDQFGTSLTEIKKENSEIKGVMRTLEREHKGLERRFEVLEQRMKGSSSGRSTRLPSEDGDEAEDGINTPLNPYQQQFGFNSMNSNSGGGGGTKFVPRAQNPFERSGGDSRNRDPWSNWRASKTENEGHEGRDKPQILAVNGWERNTLNDDIEKEIKSWIEKISEHSKNLIDRYAAAGVRSTSAFIHVKKGCT